MLPSEMGSLRTTKSVGVLSRARRALPGADGRSRDPADAPADGGASIAPTKYHTLSPSMDTRDLDDLPTRLASRSRSRDYGRSASKEDDLANLWYALDDDGAVLDDALADDSRGPGSPAAPSPPRAPPPSAPRARRWLDEPRELRQLSIDRLEPTTPPGASADYLLALQSLDDGYFEGRGAGDGAAASPRPPPEAASPKTRDRRKSDDIYDEMLASARRPFPPRAAPAATAPPPPRARADAPRGPAVGRGDGRGRRASRRRPREPRRRRPGPRGARRPPREQEEARPRARQGAAARAAAHRAAADAEPHRGRPALLGRPRGVGGGPARAAGGGRGDGRRGRRAARGARRRAVGPRGDAGHRRGDAGQEPAHARDGRRLRARPPRGRAPVAARRRVEAHGAPRHPRVAPAAHQGEPRGTARQRRRVAGDARGAHLGRAPGRVEINRRFGGSPPNFGTLELGRIEVDSADFWTNGWLSSSSRSTAEASGPTRSLVRTLKSG